MNLPDLFAELHFKTSRSGGSGGQNVNKVETKVMLSFDIAGSPLLTERQKEILLVKLVNRLNKEGILQLTEQSKRSQLENKELVIKKFYDLLKKALTPVKKRRPTKTPKSVLERRKTDKRKVSQKKQQRQVRSD